MEICLHKMRTVELKTPAWCQDRNSWGTKVFAPFPPLSNLRTEPRKIISLIRSVRGTSRAKETWEQISPPFQFSHLLQSLVPPSPWSYHWPEIYNILLKWTWVPSRCFLRVDFQWEMTKPASFSFVNLSWDSGPCFSYEFRKVNGTKLIFFSLLHNHLQDYILT